MCLNAVVLNDSLIFFFLLYVILFIYFLCLISELFGVFFFKCILSVSFCCGLFMYCSSVLCGLNQGIIAKEPCAQSTSRRINNDDEVGEMFYCQTGDVFGCHAQKNNQTILHNKTKQTKYI